MFQSIEKYCKTKYGYGSPKDVDRPGYVEDRMESFFLAETLKYLYLLFDPDSEIDILNKVRCLVLCWGLRPLPLAFISNFKTLSYLFALSSMCSIQRLTH